MKSILHSAVLGGLMLAGVASFAEPIKAVVILREGDNKQVVDLRGFSEGQVWYGPSDANKFGFYPMDIAKIGFNLKDLIDGDKVNKLMQSRSYKEVIDLLEDGMAPFVEYNFLDSNLTPYQYMLMEVYYKTGQYEKSLKYSRMLADPGREESWSPRCDEKVERKAYVYQGLALMEMKRVAEAEALFALRGWTQDLPDDAPAEDLYITAKFLMMKDEYAKAIEMAAKVVAFNSQDPEWLRPAELLCAQLYTKLGLFDSASEVVREIQAMYANTDEADQAAALQARMSELQDAWQEQNK